jgi:hypothetical protein
MFGARDLSPRNHILGKSERRRARPQHGVIRYQGNIGRGRQQPRGSLANITTPTEEVRAIPDVRLPFVDRLSPVADADRARMRGAGHRV